MMLRNKALTEKVLMLGIDGMDPRYTRRLVNEGKLPNVKKLMELGACRDDLMLLGANPTITPPMWATLATGAYPMTHSIQDFNLSGEDLEITYTAIYSTYMKAEPLWDITAKAGKKTLIMHWPGGAWPPTMDDENLIVIDGSSPGAACSVSNAIDFDTVFIASSKAQKPSWMPYSIRTSDVQGDETLSYLGLPQKSSQSPEAKELMAKYYKEYAELNEVPGYTTPAHFITNSVQFEEPEKEFSGKGLMWDLADFPSACSISPVFPPQQWGFEVPADAKEFVMLTLGGKVVRYCLVLKDENGKYNKVAMYADKSKDEPIAVLENDVYTPYVMDVVPTANGMEPVHRTFRILEIAEDASYVRIWASRAMSCVNDSVWQPKALFKEITETIGQLVPTSQMTGNDPDMIMKCNYPQWQMAADWQSKVMHHMIDEHGVEVIFSHMHNVDLQGHNYMKYMKNRETSRYPLFINK